MKKTVQLSLRLYEDDLALADELIHTGVHTPLRRFILAGVPLSRSLILREAMKIGLEQLAEQAEAARAARESSER